MSNPETYSRNDRRFWMGILFVIIGGAWLLDNLNLIPYFIDDMLFNWKTLLILIGFYFIVGRKKTEAGIIMIAIGSLFLLDDFNYFHWRDVIQLFWPILIIAIGISLMVGRSYLSSKKKAHHDSIDSIDEFSMFGGHNRSIDSKNFSGGKVTAIFGGSEIDLRGAELAEGENVLDLFVMFGGSVLIVPPNWAIQDEVFAILGGFSDERSTALKVVPEPGKSLIIKGFVMFGGGEIKLAK